MKILVTTPLLPPEIGGPATYTPEMVQRLKTNHEITVLAFADNPEPLGVPLHTIAKKQNIALRMTKFFYKTFRLGLLNDLIYAQNAMSAGLPSVIIGKIIKKPVVVKFVGDAAWENAFREGKTKKLLEEFLKKPDAGSLISIRQKIQHFVFKKSKAIVVPSEYLKRLLTVYYHLPENKIFTIYNAAEENKTNNERNPKPNQILTTGRLVPWKNVDEIILAVKILSKEISDIKLVIAGEGPELENLKNLAENLSVKDKVIFTGKVPRTETRNLRNQSEIFILNSTYEGLPHTVLSSFSASIPVIATNIPGTNEAVYDGETGLLVPPHQPKLLATAIKRLLADATLQKKLVANGYKILQEKFSWKNHVQSLTKLLESVLSEPTH